jgi:hypothetical protein
MLEFTPPSPEAFDQMMAEAEAQNRSHSRLGPAPARAEIKSVSHIHESVMNWMIANPTRSLAACAQEFGYTQAWLSTMIHSNLFQARLREKQDVLFGDLATSLNDKLAAGADIGVTKLVTQLEKSEDPKFIKETTTMMLDKLGFGASNRVGGPGVVHNAPVQQNYYMASAADLAEARGRIMHAPEPVQPQPSIAQIPPPDADEAV